jgi:peptidyl-prolyl cis-trans isomerase-like 4
MSVIIETSLGDITVDLFYDACPLACRNFLKLCKAKYYNYNIFHNVQKDLLIQSGDPTGTGKGGKCIYAPAKEFFDDEIDVRVRTFSRKGLLAMANRGTPNSNQSQFFITTGERLAYLNEKHTIFGEVTEGYDVVEKINDAFVDDKGQPWQNIRIRHTIVLDDPFDDPPGFRAPSRSPSPPATALNDRLEDTVDVFDKHGKTDEQIEEELRAKAARSRADVLMMVGDIRDADEAPPDHVLFVCKLNPATSDDDLNIIFSRFGTIKSCEVIRDAKTGESLNYAFIEFSTPQECEAAYFKMQNVLIDDRRIHVDFSQSVRKQQGAAFRMPKRLEEREQQRTRDFRSQRTSSASAQPPRREPRARSPPRRDRSRSRSRSPRRRDRSRSPRRSHKHERRDDRHRKH